GLSEPSPSGTLVAWQSSHVDAMGCDTVSVLSADTGETLWTQRIEDPMHRGGRGPRRAGAPDRTATVPTACALRPPRAAPGPAPPARRGGRSGSRTRCTAAASARGAWGRPTAR